MISRREFFNQTAGSIAAAGSIASIASEVYGKPLGMPIGSQVYPHSSRIKDGDFAGLLKDMHDIGIEQIELDSPDYPNCVSLADGKQTKKIMDDHGIKCPSVHYTMKELRANMPHVLEWNHLVGAKHVSTATLAGKSDAGKTTMDEVKRAADEWNGICAQVAKAGFKTTLHDEIFEMAKVEDGSLVYTHLMDLLDPKTAFFQFQISSMRVVGDPIMYFNKYPGRFISMHCQGVNTNAPPPPPPVAGAGGRAVGGRGRGGPQLALGEDTLDWKAIFTAAKKGGLENYFVEQNWEATVKSIAYLKTLNV